MTQTFLDAIRADVDELIHTRQMHRARELKQLTGQHFNHNEYPMFFTGDLAAPFVLVHLNPWHPTNGAPTHQGKLRFDTVEAYITFHRHFGRYMYGPDAARTHRSPFDSKQIEFIRPFRVIDFVPERISADRFTNLERVIDQKLQLELIPYSSQTFSAKGFSAAILQSHVDRVLDVIAAHPRQYVIFCGNVFEIVFEQYITARHADRLIKKNGQLTQNRTRFSNLEIDYRGQPVRAGLAHSFAQHGIPMAAYGQYCHELY